MDGAEPHFRRAVAMGEELFAEDDVTLAGSRLHLGTCLGWMDGRWEQAESLLLQAFDTLESKLPAGHSQLVKAIHKIATAYPVNDQPDEAESWRSRLPSR